MSRALAALAAARFLAGCAYPASVPARSRSTPDITGNVAYTGSVTSTRRYWIDLADHQALRSTGKGTYRLSDAHTVPSGQPGGPSQVDFNGEIKTEQGRI